MQNQYKMNRIFLAALMLFIFSCSDKENLETIEALQTQLTAHKMKTDLAIKNKNTVKDFFNALMAEDAIAVSNLFAVDGKQINPYHSNLFPKGAEGKDAILKYWEPVFPNFDGMIFSIEELYAMEDPNRVFVKYTGNIKLKDNIGVYSNNYYSTFKFNSQGKITEYVEIFNPITAAKGFGLLDKIK